jgi:hypothetical protein
MGTIFIVDMKKHQRPKKTCKKKNICTNSKEKVKHKIRSLFAQNKMLTSQKSFGSHPFSQN